MLVVEHRVRALNSCQTMVMRVAGPAPATHLFLCTGFIEVDAACVVQRSGMINTMPSDPLPLALTLPDSNRNYLTLTSDDGTPLTIRSWTAMATFPMIDLSQNTSPVRREICGTEVHQSGPNAQLVVWLKVNSTDSQVAIGYQVSILAGTSASP